MRPLPFPFPLHIGTDICHIPRIVDILRSRHCSRFIRRVLTPEELRNNNPAISRTLSAVEEITVKKTVGFAGVAGTAPTLPKRGKRRWLEEEEHGEEPDLDRWGKKLQEEEDLSPEVLHMYRRAGQFMAGRFAAKEAAFKAHPHLRLRFHDILILPSSSAAKLIGEDMVLGMPTAPVAIIKTPNRLQMARISISHDALYSTATCIGFEADPEGDKPGREEPSKGWFARVSRLWSSG